MDTYLPRGLQAAPWLSPGLQLSGGLKDTWKICSSSKGRHWFSGKGAGWLVSGLPQGDGLLLGVSRCMHEDGSRRERLSCCITHLNLRITHYIFGFLFIILYPRNEVRGGILDSPCLSVCPSVCLSVCLSVCPLTFRVRPVASTVQDGFFPYLVQMINSTRGCVACDDLWPWPISSRLFGLDLKNRVRSVASTVLDGFFLYMAQIITIIRGCVACYDFFRIRKIEILFSFGRKR